ncbi:MAG: hypothetical protein LBV01_05525, partial [Deltaproteobacteria bacterium]|nr:hypothetical protein [Deltaproteobacteria bacterium]
SLARFCRGRKIGDIVAGTFLRRENDALGWALLEGEELLARLPSEGPCPLEGERVFFSVEALAPEVVLRLLPGTDPLARLALALPSLPLSQEASLYAAARDRLDALLAAEDEAPPSGGCAARREAFAARLGRRPALFSAFVETLARSRALRRAAAPAGLLFFHHLPWLSRAVSRLEVSLWNREDSPVFAGALLPSGDRLLLRGSVEKGLLRYRLGIVPAGGKGGAAPGDLRLPATSLAECLGPWPERGSRPPGQAADIVGSILALAAESDTMAVGRFSRKL